MKLWNLTDKDNKQQEISELVHKTIQHLGELPNIEAAVVTKNSHIRIIGNSILYDPSRLRNNLVGASVLL